MKILEIYVIQLKCSTVVKFKYIVIYLNKIGREIHCCGENFTV